MPSCVASRGLTCSSTEVTASPVLLRAHLGPPSLSSALSCVKNGDSSRASQELKVGEIVVSSEWVQMGDHVLYSSWSNWAGRGVCDECIFVGRFPLGRISRGRIPGMKDGGNFSPEGVEISHPSKWGWYGLVWGFTKCLDPECMQTKAA